MLEPTGIWLLRNEIFGASPDGLIVGGLLSACAVGIRKAKYPTLPGVEIDCYTEWHSHLHNLESHNNLKITD